ncbi:glycosyltransferase [Arthrobacter sp. SAFR-014]|jgi:galactofuranosylgalactofuranosylrhamnosyl-N-acetylglucosaminyl-diphospho-decaprenol beta-1,5/1,6-galactofuranosyltransferase|uniref:glycosyltransferase n=1 Tax=unclassified Arthrobacter TaxID=235627 RepID=UPI003F7B4128
MSAAADQQWMTLQRVILPPESQTDTLSLYVDAGPASGIRLSETDEFARNPKALDEKLHLVSSGGREVHFEDILSRHSLKVRAGEQLSFGTYFNAFPASYWRRWTPLRSVRLVVRTSGHGTITVNKSNARGTLQRVDGARVDGDAVTVFDLSLKPFGDGGWFWFDLASSRKDLTLESAEWLGEDHGREPGAVTLEITTMNKPDFCLNNARILAENTDALKHVREVLIVDQGTQKVADQPGFAEVAAELGGKLRIIDQDNLGGSGGFARGMFEAVENGSDYALLLDDDVVIEPESIIRMLTFADYCKRPTIVGAHMFDLHSRTVLHSYGEVVDSYRFLPAHPHDDMEMRHDFSLANLRQTPWLHRRVDVDFNGWWMCMIPTSVIRSIGLPLPIFIKWDDIEFGLRAREAGFATVSLPGAAVWHVSWVDKDDLVGWQAYFHGRNRLMVGLMYSTHAKGGRMIRESFQSDVKHLVSMQYFTEHGRLDALEDLFEGPAGLHENLATKLAEINKRRELYSDAQMLEDIDDFPAPAAGRGPSGVKPIGLPNRKDLVKWGVRTVARQLVKRPDAEAAERPQGFLAHRDNRWFRLAHYDSVVVSNADGTAASWYRRNPQKFKKMLVEAGQQHARLYRRWEELGEQYRSALPQITSFDAWRKTFGISAGEDS